MQCKVVVGERASTIQLTTKEVKMTTKRYIAYFRVWPKKTPSSVELTTQKDEVANHVSFNEGRIAGEYTDREGKLRGHRPGVGQRPSNMQSGWKLR